MVGASSRSEIEALILESEKLESILRALQMPPSNTPAPSAAQAAYHRWYAKARRFVPEQELSRFIDFYEGGQFVTRIKGFLANPTKESPFYNADEPNPLISQWQHPFDTTAGPALLGQRQILTEVLYSGSNIATLLDELSDMARRLPEYLRTLERYSSDQCPAPNIVNEKGLQVLLHSILRLLYADVRAEDFVSQHAGASSRVDFLLAETGVVIETKMTRKGLADRRVGEELLVDWGRYRRHPDCRAILAIVYDPEFHIDNPTALEAGLSDNSADIPTQAVVVR
jgi:hypothetical protein